jgi:hypothetical protein
VQGWLLSPSALRSGEEVWTDRAGAWRAGCGGAVAWGGRGSLSATAFSALGYFVLEPNPRGSYGQGEAFTQANRKDFGYGDLRDILAGVDAVTEEVSGRSGRVGLTGWSYGGFMTMFAVTQTQRFKAAVAGAGISDWKSYYGENSIDQWMTPYFGASVYDDPAVYAKSSAIDFIKQGEDADAGGGGRSRWGVPGAAVLRVLACAYGMSMCRRNWWSIPTRGMGLCRGILEVMAGASDRCAGAGAGWFALTSTCLFSIGAVQQ